MLPPGHGLALVAMDMGRSSSSGCAANTRPMIFSVSPPLYASAVSISEWPASRGVALSHI